MSDDDTPTQPVKKVKAIVAAASRVRLDDAKAAKSQMSKRQSWQEDAWLYFDEVAEVKFGSLFLGNGMSKVDFYAAVELDDGTKVPVNHKNSPLANTPIAESAEAEMVRLRATLGGQGELNKQATINWTIAGEFYLHGVAEKPEEGVPGTPTFKPGEPETWDVRSINEVETGTGSDDQGRPVFKVKTSPGDTGRLVDNDRETLIRMWIRHPRWSGLADCHMRALIGDCELITLMSNQQKAEAKSRQAPGLLLVPSELDFAEDDAKGDAAEQPEQNPFVAQVLKALVDPIEDPTSAASVMPLVVSGPGEHLTPDKFRLLSFARTSDAGLDERIEKRINRLARGMNVPVEVVMGHMSTTFSNAEQIDEDKFSDHFEAICEALADAYGSGFLRPNLLDVGVHTQADVDRVLVWYDASALVRTEAADPDELFDRGAISLAAYARRKGVEEDELPDDIERIRSLAERKGIFTADLTTILLKKAGVLGDSDLTVVEGEVVEGEVAETQEVARALLASAQDRSLGRRLHEVDKDLRTRLLGAAEAAMARALERAGNRLKTAARGSSIADTLRSVPATLAVAHLGPSLVASVTTEDDLLRDAWDEFEVQYKLWCRSAVDSTLELLAEHAGLSSPVLDAMDRRMKLSVDDSWTWLASTLTDEAKRFLYKPERPGAIVAAAGDRIRKKGDETVQTDKGETITKREAYARMHGDAAAREKFGEVDPTSRVQAGVIRESMARAGGETGIGGETGVVAPSNKAPVGGIATGSTTLGALADEGWSTEAFQWVYGPAQRNHFPPHRALDGKVFRNFDDPVLSNSGGWPPTPFYYPGDHRGCVCDFEPIIVPPTAMTATSTAAASTSTRTYASSLNEAQYKMLKPRWDLVYRKRVIDALRSTKDGKLLENTLSKFQSGASRGIPILRTNVQKYLSGEALEPGAVDRVENLLGAINNVPTDMVPKTMYRGMRLDGSADDVVARYSGQDHVDLGLSSFSADKSLAQSYADSGGAGAKGARAKTQTGVLMEVDNSTKTAKALPIENLSKSLLYANEKEWVSGGRYAVTSVTKRGDGTVVLKLRQMEALGA